MILVTLGPNFAHGGQVHHFIHDKQLPWHHLIKTTALRYTGTVISSFSPIQLFPYIKDLAACLKIPS